MIIKSPIAVALTGDVAGFTCYKNRKGKQVIYPAAPPLTPPSPAQQLQRARFALSMQDWRALDSSFRLEYAEACVRLNYALHGVNLYLLLSTQVSQQLRNQVSALSTTILVQPVYYGPLNRHISRFAWDRLRSYMLARKIPSRPYAFVPDPMP